MWVYKINGIGELGAAGRETNLILKKVNETTIHWYHTLITISNYVLLYIAANALFTLRMYNDMTDGPQ